MDRSSTADNFLLLPVQAVGKMDIGRLMREMDGLDGFLTQAAIREPGSPIQLPKTSKILDELIAMNSLNALRTIDRERLTLFLKTVYNDAPILHMSFSADPSPLFMQRLMTWIRQEIHPLALVQVGLQPNIGAGCVLRTKNMYFDMSLRTRFSEKREQLSIALKGAAEPAPVAAQPAVVAEGATT